MSCDQAGVLFMAPSGVPVRPHLLVWIDEDDIVDFCCERCGVQVSFDVPVADQEVRIVARTHRCGGPTWQGVLP